MAYNKDFPADDSYLADFPSNEREQIRAIVEDKIVNAGKVNGLTTSNGSGQVPVSNGTVNSNLNADLLDGHHAEYFSPSGHRHNNASTSSDGFMSSADKTKLNGVATGAEVNQNAFGNVAVGSTTLQADNKQDTLYINAGNNISIAADAANDKLTIGLSGIVPVANGGTGQSNLGKVNVGGAGALNPWANRPTTANNTFNDAKVRYYLATSEMDTGKPPSDGYILHLPWDSGSYDWDAQLFVNCYNGTVATRAQDGSADWSKSTGWKTLAFAADVPKNDGTGATGTWEINITGTSAKATNDSSGNNINSTYVKSVTYSGHTVTVTKGNGTTSTFNTADTNYMPTGTVLPFAGNTIPNGYLLCDGSAVSRSTYANLFNVIGTLYGAGDGSTTFNLPNLVERFVEGGSSSGEVKNAGLPNITGEISPLNYQITGKPKGAFGDQPARVKNDYDGYSGTGRSGFVFDASKSNPIYGASDTVQPPAIVMKYIIKI